MLQGLLVVLGILVFVRIALDVESSIGFVRNLKELAPNADTTSVEQALNVAADRNAESAADPVGWVAEQLMATESQPNIAFGLLGLVILGIGAAIWACWMWIRLNHRGSEPLFKHWFAAAAGAVLVAIALLVVVFTFLAPGDTTIVDFPYWFDIAPVIVVMVLALIATSQPLTAKPPSASKVKAEDATAATDEATASNDTIVERT